MRTQILFYLLLPIAALAEDVRLSSGQTLRNMKFNNADQTGVSLTPAGFAATATKYPWYWIHPEDAGKLQARGQAQAERDARQREIEDTAEEMRVKVTQILPTGALARVLAVWRQPRCGQTGSFVLVEKMTTIFIVGATSEKLIDGETFECKLYRCGRYQYVNYGEHVKNCWPFASDAEAAVDFLTDSS